MFTPRAGNRAPTTADIPLPDGRAVPRPRQRAAAKLITDFLAPAHLLVLLLLLVGLHSTHSAAGVGWALLAAAISVGVPMGVVVLGVRSGRFTDIHVRVRQQRAVPLLFAISSALAGIVLLALLGAPRELVALLAAILAGLTAGALVTVWWKVSGHTAVAGAAVVILTAVYGAPLLALLALAPPIGWSRVVLRDHTLAQTVVGFLIGAVVSLGVFVPLG